LLNCYNKLNISEKNLDEIRKHQEERIEALITVIQNINLKNVVVIGHHPIISIKTKQKEGKITNNLACLKLLKDLYYNSIYLPLKELNKQISYYYLCADVHLYQQGTIFINKESKNELVINQYITGTGGTNLDDYIQNDKIKLKDSCKQEDIKYLINDNKITYGFLDCNINKDNGELDFEFIEVK